MTVTNLSLSFDPAAFGVDIANLKRATTGVDNATNRAGRSAFAALLTGGMDKSQITAAVLATYGNPKSASGKTSSSLSVLRMVGAEPCEKAFNAVFALFAKTVAGDDDCELTTAHRASVREAIVGYALETKGAPVRLYGLVNAVKALDKAHVESLMPAVADEKAKEEAKADAIPTDGAPQMTRLDQIKAFAEMLASTNAEPATDMELLALDVVFNAIADMSRNAADEKIAVNG